MASVHKKTHPSGREVWICTWRKPDGHQTNKTFTLKRDAERHKAQITTDMARGVYIDPKAGQVTVEAWCESWRAKQRHWAAGTAEHVEIVFRRHLYPVLGGHPVGTLRRSDIEAWVAYLEAVPLAPTTVEVAFSHLYGAMTAAVVDGLLASNPCTGVKLPKIRSLEVVPPTVSEVETLTRLLPPQWRAIVAVGIGLGLRSGEALGLTVDRVNFLGREVQVNQQAMTLNGVDPHHAGTKNDSNRIVPLPDTVATRLAAHLQRYGEGENRLVFHREDGSMWRRQRLSDAINRAVALSAGELPDGFKYRHLRHFYASHLIASGASVKTVQHHMGHSSAMVTLDVYAHMWPGEEEATRKAVDVMFGKMLREGTSG